MVQVNATSTLGVIDALDSGYGGCQAAIVPDQEAYYALGVADTGSASRASHRSSHAP